MLYARSTDDKINKKDWQTLEAHLSGVTKRAVEFAEPFGGEQWAKALGILHDIGKSSDEFQIRLTGGPAVDHATAGAHEACKLYGSQMGKLLSYAICGHHGGLPNGGDTIERGSLTERLMRTVPDYSLWCTCLPDELPEAGKLKIPLQILCGYKGGFQLSFFVRMLYSCLVDADALDAEWALEKAKSKLRAQWEPLALALPRLKTFLAKQEAGTLAARPINVRRTQLREQVTAAAKKPRGIFSLTIPTGGGKTQISLAFALKHAEEWGLERIIYVIPFTSIIEQNADVFRNILGEQMVLEHHSNVSIEKIKDRYVKHAIAPEKDAVTFAEKCQLASENWDAPLVVTTNVQALESLFANKPSRCRKLHNMANSLLIFDEAQMIPRQFLQPALVTMSELVDNYGSSVILCTATQPVWDKVRYIKGLNNVDLLGKRGIQELAPEPKKLYEEFRRVRAVYIGPKTDEDLTQQFCDLDQVLCIVNTRKHAQRLFALLKDRVRDDSLFHLSTRMCPAHRRIQLSIIRERLKHKLPCRVISTQLIEAGVDVDFPVVYRATAGIDSIVQAAGRCNREQTQKEGQVSIFWPEKHGLPQGYFSLTAELAKEVFQEIADPLSLEAVAAYFRKLYALGGENSLDEEKILSDIETSARTLSYDFPAIAEKFQLIDSPTESVIIPWMPYFCTDTRNDISFYDGLAVIEQQIHEEESSMALQRYLQPITIQMYQHELEKMQDDNLVYCYEDPYKKRAYWVLTEERAYDAEQGVLLTDLPEAPVYMF